MDLMRKKVKRALELQKQMAALEVAKKKLIKEYNEIMGVENNEESN